MIERVDASMSETREEFLKLQARTEASVSTLQETISALESKAAAGGSGSLVLLRSLQEQVKVIEKAASHERVVRKSEDSAREVRLLKELEAHSAKVMAHIQEVKDTLKSTEVKISKSGSSTSTNSGTSSSSTTSGTSSSSSSSTSGSSGTSSGTSSSSSRTSSGTSSSGTSS